MNYLCMFCICYMFLLLSCPTIVSTPSLQTNCTEGDIRLVNGSNAYQGRVEVCHLKVWGTVCHDEWNRKDGIVACRQMRFRFLHFTRYSYFGEGTGQIWLDNLSCRGTEMRLTDCPHSGFGVHNCSHNEEAGVVCEGKRFLLHSECLVPKCSYTNLNFLFNFIYFDKCPLTLESGCI